MIKLIVSDFDGTLVPLDGIYEDLADDVLRLLFRLREQGVECMIATGRHPSFISKRIKKFSFPTIVGCSGNLDYIDGEVDAFSFTREELWSISEWARENTPYGLNMRTLENTAVYQLPEYRDRDLHLTEKQRLKKDIGTISELLTEEYLAQKEIGTVVRIMLRAYNMEQLPGIKAHFEKAFPRFRLVKTGGTAVDVMIHERSKASEIEKIMKLRGLTRDEVATVGDGENDYEMLKGFRHSFYVGPGNPWLEQAAGHRKSCIQEMLAAVLEMNGG